MLQTCSALLLKPLARAAELCDAVPKGACFMKMHYFSIMYLPAYNFAHTPTPCVSIVGTTDVLLYYFFTTIGVALQLVPIPLVSPIFNITFSPYLYVCTSYVLRKPTDRSVGLSVCRSVGLSAGPRTGARTPADRQTDEPTDR